MLRLEDLDSGTRAWLSQFEGHSGIHVGTGAKDLFVYVRNKQLKKRVEASMPEALRGRVRVIVTGAVRPASV